MEAAVPPGPDNIEALKLALAAAQARAVLAEAELASARAKASSDQAQIAHLKLQIAKLQRDRFSPHAERTARLLDQLELELEELEASASEDELAAEMAAAKTTSVAAFARARPSRKPFPDHLPRERVVQPAPCSCAVCGGTRLSKLGEDVAETLEVIPRQWKVIQHVREKFSCRDCEAVSQPPAPFHVVPRGWAGPSFLAMLLFEKFGQHQPLNRQAERYAREGVPLSLSTLADQVGAGTAALMPLFERLQAHVLAAERLHGDDTTVPVLARGKTDTGRLWVYVRDDAPFAATAPPAALFYYSRNRRGEHPQAHLATWSGLLQADAYSGYGDLYTPGRSPGVILEVGCWAHLWIPPLLQGILLHFWQYPRLQSSIRPVVAKRLASPALMVNPQADSQSRFTSSKLDAPNGFMSAPVRPVLPSCLEQASHPRRPYCGRTQICLTRPGVLDCRTFRRAGAAPRRSGPSYSPLQPLRHSRGADRANARAKANCGHANA